MQYFNYYWNNTFTIQVPPLKHFSLFSYGEFTLEVLPRRTVCQEPGGLTRHSH
jgi:hypothetical protein